MDERRLRKFFHFSDQDLLANQRGQISQDQNRRLLQEARAEQASARSSAAILLVIAAAGLAIGITITSIAPSSIGRILVFLLMGILWPSAWAGKGIQILRAARALQQPSLGKVSGQARILRHAEGDYQLEIGERQFDLDRNPSGAIIEGDEYTVYYLEATEEIFSVQYCVQSEAS